MSDIQRVYLIQVLIPNNAPVSDIIVPEDVLDIAINDIKYRYPEYSKIVIYDAESKDAVRIIKAE